MDPQSSRYTSSVPRTQLTQLLLYCYDKTPWPKQFIKENVEFEAHGSRELESKTIVAESLAAGRQAW